MATHTAAHPAGHGSASGSDRDGEGGGRDVPQDRSDKALLHEKWERIEFEKTRSALIKLPDAVIDAVCGGKPCWRLSTQGFGPFSTTAFRFRSEGKDAPDLYETQARLTLTMGVDIFPFCATGEHFEVISAPPNPKCRFSTALDTMFFAPVHGWRSTVLR